MSGRGKIEVESWCSTVLFDDANQQAAFMPPYQTDLYVDLNGSTQRCHRSQIKHSSLFRFGFSFDTRLSSPLLSSGYPGIPGLHANCGKSDCKRSWPRGARRKSEGGLFNLRLIFPTSFPTSRFSPPTLYSVHHQGSFCACWTAMDQTPNHVRELLPPVDFVSYQ